LIPTFAMSATPPIESKRFEHLSDPGVAAYFRELCAPPAPLTMRPLPKLIERLVVKPWATRVPCTATRTSLELEGAGGAKVTIAFWQHIQTFQVRARDPSGTETVVGQGLHVGLVERMISEAAAKWL
jgi:hypothetical protein